MKGQYLAVESLLTFGLGIMLAIGIISLFEIYSSEMYQTSEEMQAKSAQYDMYTALKTMQFVEGEAEKNIDLPGSVGNEDYVMDISEGVTVITDTSSYNKKFPENLTADGYASGESKISKIDNRYRLGER